MESFADRRAREEKERFAPIVPSKSCPKRIEQVASFYEGTSKQELALAFTNWIRDELIAMGIYESSLDYHSKWMPLKKILMNKWNKTHPKKL